MDKQKQYRNKGNFAFVFLVHNQFRTYYRFHRIELEVHMKKLFIIGNGFDLAHGLKTLYKNFHTYLRQTYFDHEDVCDEDFESNDFYYDADLPEFSVGNHGEDVCHEIILLFFLGKVISNAE